MSLDLSQCSSPIERLALRMEFMVPLCVGRVKNKTLKVELLELIDFFVTKYDQQPSSIVRVPGRVNLIGEHIDYCGFPVCPVAFDTKHILVAIAENTSSNEFIKCCNMDSSYPDAVVKEYKRNLEINYATQEWFSYLLCGVQGIIDRNEELKDFVSPKNMLIAVKGSIPPSVGLSSSSALVCASFIAVGELNGVISSLSKVDISTLCAEAEHYVGTAGGGMDQAIAINAKKAGGQETEMAI